MENKFSIIENILAMRTRRTDTPSPASTIVGTDPEITTANHHPPPQTMSTRRAATVLSPAIQRKTPQNSTIYEQIMASRRAALLISTRQTPAPAISNRKTNWSYNEEKDEEEPFGFKKEFFYNNDDFYTKYR